MGNSVDKKLTRYVQGGQSYTSLDKKRLKWWDRIVFERTDDDIAYTIKPEYAQRPDRIAFDVYGKANLAWLVLQYNTIVDVVDELIAGKVIRLPQPERVFFDMLNKQTGGISEST